MFTMVPVEGVSWTELRVNAKERTEVPGGGVNGTAARVRLSDALPPPPPMVFGRPLQDERVIDASKRTGKNESAWLRFMWLPTKEYPPPPTPAPPTPTPPTPPPH